MGAVVFHDVGDIRLGTVPDPSLPRPDMAVARNAEVVDFAREDAVEMIRELTGAMDAYRTFDQRRSVWMKVTLDPAA